MEALESNELARRAIKAKPIMPFTWKPGQSGNPGGAPAWLRKAKKALGKHAEEAAAVLVDVMRNGNNNERVRAADIILKYSVPKPEASVSVTANPVHPMLTPAVAAKIVELSQLCDSDDANPQ